MAGKIFINYRRGDDPGNTGRLFDRLQDVFQPQQLFLDVDSIAPGLDFVRVLNERVAECDVVLAVIGKGWIDARNAAGARRLDDPDDFVRTEISLALNQGKQVIPVLVGEAHMPRPEELPEVLRPLARRNAVRLTHERFRADMQGLVKALQQTLEEIDALRRAQVEAAPRAQAEEERKRERAKAHRDAMASDVPALLRSFLHSYPKGSDSDQARVRLRRLEPPPKWNMSRTAIVILGGFAVVLIAGAILFLVKNTSAPPSTPQTAAVGTPPPALAMSTPVAPPEDRTLSETKVTPGPSPDEVTWLLLKDTTDDAALKRFTAQYPNSLLRKDAEARIAALAAAQAGKPPPPAPDQMAWNLVKDSNDSDQLRRFVEEFPNSPMGPDAEQRMAALSANAPQSTITNAPDPHELARSLQFELKRVGCFNSVVNGEFDDPTKVAWHRFMKLTSLSMPDDVSSDAINAVRGINKRVCPLVCSAGEHAEGEQCVGSAPKSVTTDAAHSRPAPTPRQPAPAPRATGKCFSYQGKQFCE